MRLVEVAHNLGCTAITGASALGERLAAAAVAVGKNGLHMYRTHEQDPVLIVDGILVTGSQIMSAAMRLNSEGAPRPAAAVVVSTCDIDLSSAIDQLVVLEP
jgi:orotate phosphoribosyltransferase